MEKLAFAELSGAGVKHCADCDREIREIRRLDALLIRRPDLLDEFATEARVGRRRSDPRLTMLLSGAPRQRIAAALLACSLLLLWFVEPISEGAGRWRGESDRITAAARWTSGREILVEWDAPATVDHYVVHCWGEDGERLAERTSLAHKWVVTIPPKERGPILWSVEAWRDGQRVATTGIRELSSYRERRR